MAGTVSMTGLVSDTDWASLVTKMIDAQKAAVINPLTDTKTKYEDKLAAWQSFNTMLSAITNYIDTNTLNEDEGYAFCTSSLQATDTSITPGNVLSVALGSEAGPGNYSIEVSTLAAAEKISSDSFLSKTNDLSLAGDIVLNNKTISIATTDSLIDIADKINDAGAGVIATILTISSTSHKLLIESEATGASVMSFKNGSSVDILESLNLHTSTQLAHASGADALSDTYTSSSSALGTLMGLATSESGTVGIRGTDDVMTYVPVNLATASLESIRDYINNTARPTGVTASVETVTSGSTTSYRLKLTNVDINDFQDDKNILETLGIVEGTAKNPITTGQDASLTIDGNPITSSSNTLTDTIPGVTVTLKSTNSGSPIDLRVTRDSSKISTTVSTLVTNINNVLTYISDQNTYNSSDEKPLMGDVSLNMVRTNVVDALYTTVSGNTTYTTASSIGITFDKTGVLSLDTSALSTALTKNRDEVVNVLKSFSDSLYDKIDVYVDPYTGTLTSVETSIKDSVARIEERIKEATERFERQALVLEQRFNALESLISSSTMTKSWLTQQTEALSSMWSK